MAPEIVQNLKKATQGWFRTYGSVSAVSASYAGSGTASDPYPYVPDEALIPAVRPVLAEVFALDESRFTISVHRIQGDFIPRTHDHHYLKVAVRVDFRPHLT